MAPRATDLPIDLFRVPAHHRFMTIDDSVPAPRAAPQIDLCTAAILAGGRGTRMGSVAKGLLVVDGEPIVARIMRTLAPLFPRVVLIANDATPYKSFGLEMFPDLLPDKGAPGGVHSALTRAYFASDRPRRQWLLGAREMGKTDGTEVEPNLSAEWLFVVACDMPHLDPRTIRWLASQRDSRCDVVLVECGGHLQPLHAFYRVATCLAAFDRTLRTVDASLIDLLAKVRTTFISEQTFLNAHPSPQSFRNINTIDDL